MEGLKRIAVDYYKKASAAEKNQVAEFFRKVDTNADGKVSFAELKDAGIISNKSFFEFNKFDVNYDGVLDLEEIGTLYFFKYTVGEFMKSYDPHKFGRTRWCDGCNSKQRNGQDYSCFWCIYNGHTVYDLCRHCYLADVQRKHQHAGLSGMISDESLALLKVMKNVLFEEGKKMKPHEVKQAIEGLGVGAGIGTAAAAVVLACSIM